LYISTTAMDITPSFVDSLAAGSDAK
jgi:hypothetical protein